MKFKNYFTLIANDLAFMDIFSESFTDERLAHKRKFSNIIFLRLSLPINACLLKSMGLNNSVKSISNVLLINVKYYIADLLVHIFNKSLNRAILPYALECAVLAFLKKDYYNSVGNYRQISICSPCSLIFGKLFKMRMLLYLKNKNFSNRSKFGLRNDNPQRINFLLFPVIIILWRDSL